MSEAVADFPVYLGIWTNWAHGKVYGLTLTLSRQNSALLVAFTAFFVAFTGARLWHLIAITAHFVRSRVDAQDALYHQRQAVFRNTVTPGSALWHLVKLMWAWRKSPAPRKWRRMLPAALIATVCAVGFLLASGFSSLTTTTVGDEVLIASSKCSYMNELPDDIGTIGDMAQTWIPWVTKSWDNAGNYARQCYQQDREGFLKCSTFIQNALPFTVNTTAACPFSEEMCRTKDKNIILDTGLLDSNDHFGLNAPQDERIQFRKVMHCAPLVTEGYTEQANSSEAGRVQNGTSAYSVPVTRYNYGPYRIATPYGRLRDNWTVEWRNNKEHNNQKTNIDYTLSSAFFTPKGGQYHNVSEWQPLPSLRRRDASTTIIFLSSNQLPFLNRTTDLWFEATKPLVVWLNGVGTGNVTQTGYLMDEVASPLGCIEQEQLCTDNGKRCGKLGPLVDVPANTEAITNADGELNRFVWTYNILTTPSIRLMDVIANQRQSSLLARTRMSRNAQGYLPDNQWQLEAQNWFSSQLASMQQAFVRSAIGPPTPELEKFSIGPSSEQSIQLCKSQKVRSTNYTSFSMLGLLCIVIIGGLIILASYITEPIIAHLSHRRPNPSHAYVEWVSNSTLQLQRLAHQGAGAGRWLGVTNDVPITEAGDMLAMLELERGDGGGRRGDPEKHAIRLVQQRTNTDLSKVLSPSSTIKTAPPVYEVAENPRLESLDFESPTRTNTTRTNSTGGRRPSNEDRITPKNEEKDEQDDQTRPENVAGAKVSSNAPSAAQS